MFDPAGYFSPSGLGFVRSASLEPVGHGRTRSPRHLHDGSALAFGTLFSSQGASRPLWALLSGPRDTKRPPVLKPAARRSRSDCTNQARVRRTSCMFELSERGFPIRDSLPRGPPEGSHMVRPHPGAVKPLPVGPMPSSLGQFGAKPDESPSAHLEEGVGQFADRVLP